MGRVVQIKKKKIFNVHKDKEAIIMQEMNTDELENIFKNLLDENQSDDTFCDVQHTKKKKRKHKKSKKNKSKEKITDENNGMQIADENEQSVNSHSNKQQAKKKHKKSKSIANEETDAESRIEIPSVNSDFGTSFYDLKQKKKRNKKSKTCKDKETTSSVENNIVDFSNKECETYDSLNNVLKKNYKRCESSARKKPAILEENNVFNVSQIGDDILSENSSLGTQMMKNIHKSDRTNSTAAECLSSSSMTKLLENISQMSDIDDRSKDDNHNSNHNENIRQIDESSQETDYFNLDFNEVLVDFDIPPLHAFETVHPLTKEQKDELLSKGIKIKTGRFTHDEDKILLKNFEKFSRTYGTLDICDTLGMGGASKNSKIQQFLKAKHFYLRLGEGLTDRTLFSIYKRARLLLNPYKNNDKLSQIEVEKIKHLRTTLKKNWIYISESLEQPPDKCLQTFRWRGKSISRGKWTEEEEKELIAAMKKVTGSSDLSPDKVKKISWEKVAIYVPSRNSTQCRMHWANHLKRKSGTDIDKWNKINYKKLVEMLYKDWYVEDVTKIDWFKIYESFTNISPSPLHVQKRWLYLKTKIDNFKKKNYKTILNELCTLYKVSLNETLNVPFSSSAINQRLSRSIANMKKIV